MQRKLLAFFINANYCLILIILKSSFTISKLRYLKNKNVLYFTLMKNAKLFVITLIFALFFQYNTVFSQQKHSKTLILMGSLFEIIVVSDNKTLADTAINKAIAEIERIEKLISSWKPNSETSLINKNAGIKAVKVSKELFELINRSKKISVLTKGAFDISFAPMNEIWSFNGKNTYFPPLDSINRKLQLIDYQYIILNNKDTSVFLKNKGMKIGFGAIGKGYAANSAKIVIENCGIKNGVVNAGGDIIAWGKNEKNDFWRIGITDPNDKTKSIAWLSIENMAVVTSGNYENYFVNNNQIYSHIINPKTGIPTQGIKSVTIFCPDAEIADALATSVFVLGVKQGIELINMLKNIECLIITSDNKSVQSSNLNLNFYNIENADFKVNE